MYNQLKILRGAGKRIYTDSTWNMDKEKTCLNDNF